MSIWRRRPPVPPAVTRAVTRAPVPPWATVAMSSERSGTACGPSSLKPFEGRWVVAGGHDHPTAQAQLVNGPADHRRGAESERGDGHAGAGEAVDRGLVELARRGARVVSDCDGLAALPTQPRREAAPHMRGGRRVDLLRREAADVVGADRVWRQRCVRRGHGVTLWVSSVRRTHDSGTDRGVDRALVGGRRRV